MMNNSRKNMPMIAALTTAFRLAVIALLAGLSIGSASAQTAPQASKAPAVPAQNLENILYLDLSTGGRVSILLRPDIAPNHVERIKTLTRAGFYDGIIFHRVIDGFMAQTGDPTGTGTGASNLPDLKAEFTRMPHLRGTVSAAREGGNEDSANSQFFITFLPRFDLDRKYSVFGRVISGMQFIDQIARGEPPANPDRILQASIAADGKPEPNYTAAVPIAPAPAAAAGAEEPISVK